MKFSDASAFVLGFGKYKGKSIDTVAMTDEGLLYLDWLQGEGLIAPVLDAYLGDPTIAADLAKLAKRA